MTPDQGRVGGGEALQEALGDESDLDVAVIGLQLAADGGAVGCGFAMEELVALKPAQRRHGAHPEVIRPSADGVEGLLESDLDLEAQGVEPDDLRRREGQVGAEEQDLAALGMHDRHEAHKPAGRPPEQIAADILQGDVPVVVDRTRHRLQGAGEKIAQPDFCAVAFRPAAPGAPRARRRGVGAGIFLEPGNEVAAPVEQSDDDLAAGVVGIGNQQHRFGELQGLEQEQEFVEERPTIAVGKHEAFVNARGQGNGLKTRPGLDQQGQRLARVAHDILGLRVGVRSLMEGFDRRHLAARLGLLQAVGEQHEAAVDPLHPGMDLEDDPHPNPRQGIDTDGGAVEEIEQAAVAGRLKSEGAHEAGNSAQVPADAQGGERHRQPQKGALARARRTQLRDDQPPVGPEEHRQRLTLAP